MEFIVESLIIIYLAKQSFADLAFPSMVDLFEKEEKLLQENLAVKGTPEIWPCGRRLFNAFGTYQKSLKHIFTVYCVVALGALQFTCTIDLMELFVSKEQLLAQNKIRFSDSKFLPP